MAVENIRLTPDQARNYKLVDSSTTSPVGKSAGGKEAPVAKGVLTSIPLLEDLAFALNHIADTDTVKSASIGKSRNHG